LGDLFSIWQRKSCVGQDLVTVGLVQILIFILQLKTGGPKLLFVSAHCLGTKASHDSTNLFFLFAIFSVILIEPECRTVGSLSDLVVLTQLQ
jgi:hypothetical protein